MMPLMRFKLSSLEQGASKAKHYLEEGLEISRGAAVGLVLWDGRYNGGASAGARSQHHEFSRD